MVDVVTVRIDACLTLEQWITLQRALLRNEKFSPYEIDVLNVLNKYSKFQPDITFDDDDLPL